MGVAQKVIQTIKEFLIPNNHLTLLHKQNCLHADYLVIDLELTGLNPKEDEIVSIAWLPIKNQRIYVGQGEHFINSQVSCLKQSPIFHGINQQAVQSGQPLTKALLKLVSLLDSVVFVFHNAELDWAFLQKAFIEHGIIFSTEQYKSIIILDTMKIEHKRLSRLSHDISFDALNLEKCRHRYNLPDYSNHNALTDAMATAELLLAQINHISSGKPLAVKSLL
ncbi:3'-5' exonuclease [Pseudoalteromonas sp. C2R02]|uniref:3'-5' exonuclease n=1 Tax=Pseudoalteromonas sp. C2R02 TaxID=2841565 RepID=UPI001C093460|nr:3'-5' exonuclease [Pseudoalteromonas sp. C2R02]MBU2969630.1 3'-5' exonuclease [Pseudoalteromonas sp. C2R02]